MEITALIFQFVVTLLSGFLIGWLHRQLIKSLDQNKTIMGLNHTFARKFNDVCSVNYCDKCSKKFKEAIEYKPCKILKIVKKGEN